MRQETWSVVGSRKPGRCNDVGDARAAGFFSEGAGAFATRIDIWLILPVAYACLKD